MMLFKIALLLLVTSLQLVHSNPLSSSPTSQSDSNCPSLVNCTKTCLLGMKKSADGCTVCECKDKGLFQGDIMIDENSYNDFLDLFGEENRTRISKRSAQKSSLGREWPKVRGKVIVPYVFDDTVDKGLKMTIRKAFKELRVETCVRFRQRVNEEDYIKFKRTSSDECSSFIGNLGGKQTLRLDTGCETTGIILHELMHALGFWHEHSRPDRDHYVTIVWENIKKVERRQFTKMNLTDWDSFLSPYDFKSIMHYSGTYFSKNGLPTILDKSTNLPVVVNHDKLSKEDFIQINRKYQCPVKAKRKKILKLKSKPCSDFVPNSRTTKTCSDFKNSCEDNVMKIICKASCNYC